MAQTLFDKIWDRHVVSTNAGFPDVLYVDTHYVSKETSARAFEGLRRRSVTVFRPKQTVVVAEPEYTAHIPLTHEARFQLDLLHRNCADFFIDLPERGRFCNNDCVTGWPGQIIACDAEGTENLGALGILAISVNEAQVEQLLATQALLHPKPKSMKIEVNGRLAKGISVKDIIHYLVSEITATGASGYVVEFAGETIAGLDLADKMAICNISKEIGAIAALIEPDAAALEYLSDIDPGYRTRPEALEGLFSDEACVFDEVIEFDAEDIFPGNYAIDLSRLLKENKEGGWSAVYETAGILEGYNDTDYILNHIDAIGTFERSRTEKYLTE